jgi:hypothetical protein
MTGRPQASDWHHGPDLACRPGLSPGKCRVRGPRPTNCAGWFGRLDQDFCSWWCPVMAADRVIGGRQELLARDPTRLAYVANDGTPQCPDRFQGEGRRRRPPRRSQRCRVTA